MIVESLINILFVPIEFLLGFLPDFSWTISIATGSVFVQLFMVVCYIFPIEAIRIVFALSVGLGIVRIVISLIRLILNALPFF